MIIMNADEERQGFNKKVIFFLQLRKIRICKTCKTMKKKIGMYFQLEADNNKDSLSVVKQVLSRLGQLEDEGVDVQYFELRVKKMQGQQNLVSMKLDGNGDTFIESETAYHRNEALNNGFDKIYDQLGIKNERFVKVLQYA